MNGTGTRRKPAAAGRVRPTRHRAGLNDLAQFTDVLPDPTVVVSDRGRIVRVNARFCETFGYKPGDIEGRPVEVLVPQDLRTAHAAMRADYARRPTPRPMGSGLRLTAVKSDGCSLPVDIALSPVVIGGRRHVIAVIRDISLGRKLGDQQSTLAEIGRIVGSSIEVSDLMTLARPSIERLIPFDRLAITRLMGSEGRCRIEYVSGLDVPGYAVGDEVPLGSSFTKLALDAGRPVLASVRESQAAGSTPADAHLKAGIRSILVVPLRWQSTVIGALHFGSTHDETYTTEHIGLAARLGDQISGHVATARLYQEARVEARERGLLAEISRIASSSSDISAVYPRLADAIRGLIRFDHLDFVTYSEEAATIEGVFAAGEPTVGRVIGQPVPAEGSFTLALCRDRSPIAIPHLTESVVETRFRKLRPQYESGIRSVLGAPLVSADRPFGALVFQSRVPGDYAERDIRLAAAVSAQVADAIANSLLSRQIAEESRERGAIAGIGLAVTSERDLDRVYSVMAAEIARLVPYDRLVVSLVVAESDEVEFVFVRGIQIEGAGVGTRVVPGVRNELTRSLAVGGTIVAGAVSATAGVLEAGLKSWVEVPLKSGDVEIGFLSLRSLAENAYSGRHAAFLARVAAQVAPAIANARLIGEIERSSEERAVLAAIGRTINSTSQIEDVYPEVAAEIRRLVPWDRIVLSIIDDATQTFRDAYWSGLADERWSHEQPHALAGTTTGIVRERRTHLVINARSPQELVREFPPMANSVKLGLSSALSVPVFSRDRLFGVMHLRSRTPMAYTDRHVQLALQVADQIGGGVEKSLLLVQTERETAERAAIAAIGLAVNSELDLDRIYSVVADQLNELVRYDRLVITVRTEQPGMVERAFVRGTEIPGAGVGTRIPARLEMGTERRAIRLGSPEAGEAELDLMAAAGLSSWLEVPLWAGESPIGYLSVRSETRNAYSDADGRLLESVAAQVTPAIANARLVARLAESNRQLTQSEARATAVLEGVSDAIVLADAEAHILAANVAAERMFGLARPAVPGRHLGETCVAPGSRERWLTEFAIVAGSPSLQAQARPVEFVTVRGDGTEFEAEWTLSRFELEGSTRVVAVVRDISARKLAERNLEILATTDSLTGLLNRHQFGQMLDQAIRFARRRNTTGALVYLDLDNFKYVNDTYGHRVGDQLLERIGYRLRTSVRSSDIVARTGGDEFSVVLLDTGLEDAIRKARQLLDAVGSSAVRVGGETVTSAASAGIAMFPIGDATFDDVVAFADIAMYRAKELGRSSVAVYRPEERARETVSALQRVRHLITESLANDRVVLFRQPVVSTVNRGTAFYEVLVRLRDSEGKIRMPGEFITQAESLDLVQAIDRAVFQKSIERWGAASGQRPKLAMNVSGRTIGADFVDFVVERTSALQVPPEDIHLEITETAAMRGGPGTRQCLMDLHAAGFAIVLDDFGSGLTSFRQLNELPLAMLKLDGSLVRAGAERRSDRSLLKAVVDFAHELSLPVVGEHVENEATLNMLQEFGVEYAQGHLFGRPEPFE
jgi:diguanylate cyclase (GGDEF)-like protein/PAS domain S-box-containing protein